MLVAAIDFASACEVAAALSVTSAFAFVRSVVLLVEVIAHSMLKSVV